MRQSIEGVFLVNFLVDALALAAAIRSRRLVKLSRLICAAFIGAALACLLALARVPRHAELAALVILAPPVIWIASKSLEPGLCARFMGVSLLIAGVRTALPRVPAVVCALAVCAAAVIFPSSRRRGDWHTKLHICYNDRTVGLSALIDTGNRLIEPFSGLAVTIVESDVMRGLLPAAFDPASPVSTLPCGFRVVGYGGVGGQGVMGAFMPDEIIIMREGRKVRLNDTWVGVYPGKLPGTVRALLPPSAIK